MRHLDGVGADRLGGLRRRDDLAGREDLDLEVAVGHRLDVLGEGLRGAEDGVERLREARGQPPGDLGLGLGDRRGGERRRGGAAARGYLQEVASLHGPDFLHVGWVPSPVI